MLAIDPCAEANWRSWALTPEADEIGMKRATGHFSSLITGTPSTQLLRTQTPGLRPAN